MVFIQFIVLNFLTLVFVVSQIFEKHSPLSKNLTSYAARIRSDFKVILCVCLLSVNENTFHQERQYIPKSRNRQYMCKSCHSIVSTGFRTTDKSTLGVMIPPHIHIQGRNLLLGTRISLLRAGFGIAVIIFETNET